MKGAIHKEGTKRKQPLPVFLSSGTGAFFDPAVQAILEPERTTPAEVKGFSREDRLRLLAFPIDVFQLTESLANGFKPEKTAGEWTLCYKSQPQFVADLLAAVTRFVWLPENEKTLSRKVADCADYLVTSGTDPRERRMNARLPSFIEITERLNIQNKAPEAADRIRRKEFYEERKHRAAILKCWKPNIDAFWKLVHSRPTE